MSHRNVSRIETANQDDSRVTSLLDGAQTSYARMRGLDKNDINFERNAHNLLRVVAENLLAALRQEDISSEQEASVLELVHSIFGRQFNTVARVIRFLDKQVRIETRESDLFANYKRAKESGLLASAGNIINSARRGLSRMFGESTSVTLQRGLVYVGSALVLLGLTDDAQADTSGADLVQTTDAEAEKAQIAAEIMASYATETDESEDIIEVDESTRAAYAVVEAAPVDAGFADAEVKTAYVDYDPTADVQEGYFEITNMNAEPSATEAPADEVVIAHVSSGKPIDLSGDVPTEPTTPPVGEDIVEAHKTSLEIARQSAEAPSADDEAKAIDDLIKKMLAGEKSGEALAADVDAEIKAENATAEDEAQAGFFAVATDLATGSSADLPTPTGTELPAEEPKSEPTLKADRELREANTEGASADEEAKKIDSLIKKMLAGADSADEDAAQADASIKAGYATADDEAKAGFFEVAAELAQADPDDPASVDAAIKGANATEETDPAQVDSAIKAGYAVEETDPKEVDLAIKADYADLESKVRQAAQDILVANATSGEEYETAGDEEDDAESQPEVVPTKQDSPAEYVAMAKQMDQDATEAPHALAEDLVDVKTGERDNTNWKFEPVGVHAFGGVSPIAGPVGGLAVDIVVHEELVEEHTIDGLRARQDLSHNIALENARNYSPQATASEVAAMSDDQVVENSLFGSNQELADVSKGTETIGGKEYTVYTVSLNDQEGKDVYFSMVGGNKDVLMWQEDGKIKMIFTKDVSGQFASLTHLTGIGNQAELEVTLCSATADKNGLYDLNIQDTARHDLNDKHGAIQVRINGDDKSFSVEKGETVFTSRSALADHLKTNNLSSVDKPFGTLQAEAEAADPQAKMDKTPLRGVSIIQGSTEKVSYVKSSHLEIGAGVYVGEKESSAGFAGGGEGGRRGGGGGGNNGPFSPFGSTTHNQPGAPFGTGGTTSNQPGGNP